jgi:hypothetical protein
MRVVGLRNATNPLEVADECSQGKAQRGLRPGNPKPDKESRNTNQHESTLMKAFGLVLCPSGSVISVYQRLLVFQKSAHGAKILNVSNIEH